jgi:hypothetical protein
LRQANEYVRAWAVQLLCEDKKISQVLKEFARLARGTIHPSFPLYLAAAMQRLPIDDDRWEVIEA